MSSGATSQVNGDRRRTGLERADSILQDRFAEFHVSRRRLRQAESIQLVRDRRNAANQQLGFAFTLQITGHPEFGLPFGQDRLVPIFLATLAVRQQSQTIRFRSAAQMLDIFGMAKGGKEYRRLVAAFERIFGATIFFGTESTRKHARVIQRSRINFLREAQIWYSRDPTQEVLSGSFENIIVLSDEFYKEVIAHPIPADIEAVKAFGSAPAVLDLFMWLTYRCFTAKSEERIPLFGDFGLTAQLGSVEYSRPRRFRAMLEQWLGQVRAVWPKCPAQICSDGQYLRLRPAKAVLPTTA